MFFLELSCFFCDPADVGNMISGSSASSKPSLNIQNFKIHLLLKPAAAAAKLLQSCPTLCYPIDGSPPGSPIPGIFQARVPEWGAIAFSSKSQWSYLIFKFVNNLVIPLTYYFFPLSQSLFLMRRVLSAHLLHIYLSFLFILYTHTGSALGVLVAAGATSKLLYDTKPWWFTGEC